MNLWPCGHPVTADNTRKMGRGRVRCKQCAMRTDHAAQTREQNGEFVPPPVDPNRADKLLRKFSWEAEG